MSLHINIPKIAITPEDEEDDNNLLNLAEALTDVEELFEDQISSRRNSFRKKLKIKVSDNDGYNTALEDVEASDDDDILPNIVQHNCPISLEDIDMEHYYTEENYGVAQKQFDSFEYLKLQSSNSNDMTVTNTDETPDESPLTDVEIYDTENDSEEETEIPDSDFCVGNGEVLQITTISDEIQDKTQTQLEENFLDGKTPLTPTNFPTSLLEEKVVKRPRRAPTFSQMMKHRGNAEHARMRKKKRSKTNPRKLNGHQDNSENESSDNEQRKSHAIRYALPTNSLNYESDVEEENKLQFPVCKKTFSKNMQHLKMPEYDLNVKTDEEDFECDADTYRRRVSVDSTIFQKQLDEMASCYSFTKDKNEAIQLLADERTRSSSLDAAAENVRESKILEPTKKMLISTSPIEEGGVTDTENISDIQELKGYGTRNRIEYSECDTEEETFNGMSYDSTILPDIILPPPTRTLVISEEKKSLIPTVRILPLDDNVEAFSELEEPSTEDECMNSDTELTLKTRRILHSPQLPIIEGENVTVSENSINPVHIKSTIEEVATDVEELDPDTSKVKKKNVHRLFLSPNKSPVPHFTDVEDLEISDFIGSEIDGHTDLEYLDSSDDDSFARTEMNPNRKLSLKLTFRPIIPQGFTDTEDLFGSTDEEVNYSRAETATPHEIKKEFNDACSMHTDIGSPSINYSAAEEVMYLKGGGFQDVYTDTECFIDEVNPQVQDVMDAWEYFNQGGEVNSTLKKGEIPQSSEPVDSSTSISKGQQESISDKGEGSIRPQPLDQHQLSSEMKELLKEMEEASKK